MPVPYTRRTFYDQVHNLPTGYMLTTSKKRNFRLLPFPTTTTSNTNSLTNLLNPL
jgi:hypothetical protein